MSTVIGLKYKHHRTGDIYKILYLALDCTPTRKGDVTVVYCCEADEGKVFVRNVEDFSSKFTEIATNCTEGLCQS